MSRRLPKVLSSEEVKQLLKAPNRKAPTGLRNYCMILLMSRAGLRVSEVVGEPGKPSLQVDWKEGQIRVIGKGDKERLIPLEPFVMDALEAWKKIKPKNTKHFFCTLEGEQLNRRYVNAMLERYSKRVDIQHVHPHMLRHTYATGLLSDNFNIREVQEALGHAHLNTTMIYTHVNPIEFRNKIRTRKF